ncbi:glycosyltransferase family 4 protein [Chryseobacterium sp. C-71]|uniref:glycosyltransferase family 4 protein n=1 Tax=Chryseobacterium sp. C-71 TaxID=2893882 RepID=UPI001E4C76AA|nr:glycosyltransferase family 4 protein [Chryseobacterium sp. C-71]UFH32252.1 glycosyltransferase family 4 protein [Chryseobacterium sp. C-71]
MILHITNDYSGSTVYKNLIRELDYVSIEQIVYNPVRESSRIGKNKIDLINDKSQIIYSHILSKYADRILYQKKVKKIVKDIETKVDLSKITFIHAHTWYSDGGVAYELHKKYKIPFIVAVRNTDLNLFLKYFLHERSYGREILLAADKIITISAVYKNRMSDDERLAPIILEIKNKITVIPNGLDPYWIDSKVSVRKQIENKDVIQLLYIGKFDKGKNVINLVNAVKNLNKNSTNNFALTLIGGKGNDEKRVLSAIKDQSCFNYVGRVDDLTQLKRYFQKSDIFTMPSKAETFGLVYMEALLQGLPILYTKNEGIDGLYEDLIGEKVENTSVREIENKIQLLLSNYNHYNFSIEKFSKNHDWKRIAEVYRQLYMQ